MSSVNKVILVGNLGKDPEGRTTQSGGKIVNLTLATSEKWKGADGQQQEKTEWHRIVIFNDRIADVAEKYLTKGAKVYIEGQLQTRKWADKDGVEKYSTEIVVGKFKGELTMLGAKTDDAQPKASQPQQRATAGGGGFVDDLNDTIPFGPCWQ